MAERIEVATHAGPIRIRVSGTEPVRVRVSTVPIAVKVLGLPGPMGAMGDQGPRGLEGPPGNLEAGIVIDGGNF